MSLSISAQKRTELTADEVRSAGQVPAVVYGGDRAGATPVSVSLIEFTKVYNDSGSSLIDLAVAGEPMVKVLVQDVQVDPIKSIPVHIDFRQINMNKEMSTTVELVFVGDEAAAAVKELGGTMYKNMTEVDVTCLPKDLVSEIEVDLSGLATFDDAVRVKDITLPAGIVIDNDPEQIVAKVTPPLTEDELKAMEEPVAVDLTAIEVEKKGKKEDEAGAADAE